MKYVIAGYVFVLSLLFLYAVALLWRRRKYTRLVAAADAAVGSPGGVGPVGGAGAPGGVGAVGGPGGAGGAGGGA